MSFGFSIGDFIVLADKAMMVYNLCKSAPDNYASLSRSVLFLNKILEQTCSLLTQDGQMPIMDLDALIIARNDCKETLDVVEKDYRKRNDLFVQSKNRKYIQVGWSLFHDVEGLRSKISRSIELMNMAMTTLISLSLVHSQKNQQPRSGKRSRTFKQSPGVSSERHSQTITLPSNSDVVYNILAPLLTTDPDTPYDEETTKLRVNQGFQEQDRNHRHFLVRCEVLSFCLYVINSMRQQRELSPKFTSRLARSLPELVILYDVNQDGQIDEKEYKDLMCNLIQSITEFRHRKILSYVNTLPPVSMKGLAFLPWKPQKSGAGHSSPPYGILTGLVVPERRWISNFSYTGMAKDAEAIVIRLQKFENTWLPESPLSKPERVSRSLNTVMSTALAFTLFENHKEGVRLLSDLDQTLTCIGLAMGKRAVSLNLPPLPQVDFQHRIKTSLSTSFEILSHIKSFVENLPNLDTSTLSPEKRDEEFGNLWKMHCMDFRARKISRKMELWDPDVAQNVNSLRSLPGMVEFKHAVLRQMDVLSLSKKRKINKFVGNIQFVVKLHSIKLLPNFTSKLDTDKIDLSVTTDNPLETFRTCGVRPSKGEEIELMFDRPASGHLPTVPFLQPAALWKNSTPPDFKFLAGTRVTINAECDQGSINLPGVGYPYTLFDSKLWKNPSVLIMEPSLLITRRSKYVEVTFDVDTASYHEMRSKCEGLDWDWTSELCSMLPSMYTGKLASLNPVTERSRE